MKKKAFLTSLSALAASLAMDAQAMTELPASGVFFEPELDNAFTLKTSPASARDPFVLTRSELTGEPLAYHSSHASHASHASHYSSR